ncbi:MAG: heavy metal translocating P-type ATPase [Gammaproteobacteria bacterium]
MSACFHCGEAIPPGTTFRVAFDERREAVCCAGCAAAATAIRDAGLTDYYRYRSVPAPRAAPRLPDRYAHYDTSAVEEHWTRDLGDGQRQAQVLLEGVSCAACTWLVEKRLGQLEGIREATANPATARVAIRFDATRISLGRLLAAIDALGFRPHVVGEVDTRRLAMRERRALLRRLAVAGLGMMQVMMFALALYAGAFDGMDEVTRRFFQLASLLLTVPVAFYAGSPFLRGALRSLRAGEIGMDVTVSLAILIAFFGSTWQALQGAGEVWFDSVVMFVFLLLLARHAEMRVRHGAGTTTEALLRLLPAAARRRTEAGTESVPAEALQTGDILLVPGGEIFAADAVVLGPATRADESLVTGESVPVAKPVGAAVLAGSLNAGEAVECRVTAVGESTTLSGLVRLIDRAQAGRPAMASRADRLATRFLGALLGLAGLVAVFWAWNDPSRLVPAVIAVLVVACPCALSLAVPTVLTAAHRHLARRGVLVVNPDALERLAGITDVVFDKTGTLTCGQPTVTELTLLDAGTTREGVLQLAAALESATSHPIARAFPARGPLPPLTAGVTITGEGLEGWVDGRRWRIGRAAFVASLAGPLPPAAMRHNVFLGGEGSWLAGFTVGDDLRGEAPTLLRELQASGLRVHLLSGDCRSAVASVAAELGLEHWRAEVRPEDKVTYLQSLQQGGARVAMVGDGLNDAPVLAVADVSFALQEGTALARAQADIVLAGGGLGGLRTALELSRHGLRLMRQNLRWSAAYNLLAVPAAAAGWVAPWLAAIGMSASSLGVVLNSLRVANPPRLVEVAHGKPAVDRSAQPGPRGPGLVGVFLGGRRRAVRGS